MVKKQSIADFLNEEVNEEGKNVESKKEIISEIKKDKPIQKKNIKSKSANNNLDFIFNNLEQRIENYKEEFQLESHYNVRLSNDNYNKLKHLKITNITMIHFINLIIKDVVKSEEYNKFIKK